MVTKEQDGGEGRLTPQERTTGLWRQDYRVVAGALHGGEKGKGMIITVAGMARSIRVDAAKPWSKRENDGKYRRGVQGVTIDNIGNGTAWRFPDQRFPNNPKDVLLIGAKEEGEDGACIQITAASRFNRETHEFVSLKTQREILEHLKLDRNGTARLEFRDNTNVLYFVKNLQSEEAAEPEEFIDSTDANNYLRELLGE